MNQTTQDRHVQLIRTYLPAMIAVLLARLIAAVPAFAEGIAFVDGIFADAGWIGVSVLTIVQAVVIALVLVAYQRLAQRLGDRSARKGDIWSRTEALMLGSSDRPIYVPRHGAD